MMITTASELAQLGTYNPLGAQLIFRDKVFTKGQSFSCRARQVALAVCQENPEHGGFCMLVEDGNLITIWRQTGCIQPRAISCSDSEWLEDACG